LLLDQTAINKHDGTTIDDYVNLLNNTFFASKVLILQEFDDITKYNASLLSALKEHPLIVSQRNRAHTTVMLDCYKGNALILSTEGKNRTGNPFQSLKLKDIIVTEKNAEKAPLDFAHVGTIPENFDVERAIKRLIDVMQS